MSTETTCNYCTYQYYKRLAQRKGLKYTLLPAEVGEIKGHDLFLHPPGMKVLHLTREERKRYFVCWFMEMGNKCEC